MRLNLLLLPMLLILSVSAMAEKQTINSTCGYIYNQLYPTQFSVDAGKNALKAAADRCAVNAKTNYNDSQAKDIYKKQADNCDNKHAADCKVNFLKLYQPFCGSQTNLPALDAENFKDKYKPLFNAGNNCANTTSVAHNAAFAEYFRTASDLCLQMNPYSQSTTLATTVYLCSIQDQPGARTQLDKNYCASHQTALENATAKCNAGYDALRKKYCSISGSGATAKVTCS